MISDAVDPDISCLDAARQFHRREIVVGPDRRGESVCSRVCDLNSLIEIRDESTRAIHEAEVWEEVEMQQED